MLFWTSLKAGAAKTKPKARLTGHQQPVNSILFSPDARKFASASFDKKIKLWHGRTGAFLATLAGHVGAVYALAWAPDSRLVVSASKDSTLKSLERGGRRRARLGSEERHDEDAQVRRGPGHAPGAFGRGLLRRRVAVRRGGGVGVQGPDDMYVASVVGVNALRARRLVHADDEALASRVEDVGHGLTRTASFADAVPVWILRIFPEAGAAGVYATSTSAPRHAAEATGTPRRPQARTGTDRQKSFRSASPIARGGTIVEEGVGSRPDIRQRPHWRFQL